MSNYELKIIPWAEFQKGIASHWKAEDPSTIPIYNNPYGIADFSVMSVWDKMIYFPCAYYEDETLVGYISIYNLNNSWIRPRGIFILPEYRGRGLGYKMQLASYDLFPEFFTRAFIITKEDLVEKFCEHANMRIVPGVEPLYSEFSKEYQRLLYADRIKPSENRSYYDHSAFLQKNKAAYSIGGTNNLNINRRWKWGQKMQYIEDNAGNYTKIENILGCMRNAENTL